MNPYFFLLLVLVGVNLVFVLATNFKISNICGSNNTQIEKESSTYNKDIGYSIRNIETNFKHSNNYGSNNIQIEKNSNTYNKGIGYSIRKKKNIATHKNCIFYNHIQKTAGTSMATFLSGVAKKQIGQLSSGTTPQGLVCMARCGQSKMLLTIKTQFMWDTVHPKG